MPDRVQTIICDYDAGSIIPGPSCVRDLWLEMMAGSAPSEPPLFVDRRNGGIAHRLVESFAWSIASSGGGPLLLGGDHSLTYSSYAGVAQALGVRPVVVHLDAHHDAWPTEGVTNYSVIWHLRAAGVQVRSIGVRELERPSSAPPARSQWDHLPLSADHIYLSIDFDVLAPAVFPEVSFISPVEEADGPRDLAWLASQIRTAAESGTIVAADLVEWVPARPSTVIGAVGTIYQLVVEEMLRGSGQLSVPA